MSENLPERLWTENFRGWSQTELVEHFRVTLDTYNIKRERWCCQKCYFKWRMDKTLWFKVLFWTCQIEFINISTKDHRCPEDPEWLDDSVGGFVLGPILQKRKGFVRCVSLEHTQTRFVLYCVQNLCMSRIITYKICHWKLRAEIQAVGWTH